MKFILFLDIDGVLNNRSFLTKKIEENPSLSNKNIDQLIDPENVSSLNLLFNNLPENTMFYIHSNRIKMHDLKEIKKAFKINGFKYNSRCLGIPPIKFSSEKCHEVSWALDKHNQDVFYIIIDDSYSFNFSEKDYIKQDGIEYNPTFDKGLTNDDVQNILTLINDKKNLEN